MKGVRNVIPASFPLVFHPRSHLLLEGLFSLLSPARWTSARCDGETVPSLANGRDGDTGLYSPSSWWNLAEGVQLDEVGCIFPGKKDLIPSVHPGRMHNP